MKYELIQELTPDTIAVRTEQGEDLVFDSLKFPVPPKETLRMELQKGFKEAAKQSHDIQVPNLLQYSALEKFDQGFYLVRKNFSKNGLAPFQPVNPEQTVRVLLQILEIMGSFHHNGIILGGLSLGQLQFDSRGDFYLQDPYGINYLSKSLTEEYKVDAPPEVITGKVWDQRADIFSWGVLAYRLLTGEDPFKAPTPAERLDKILKFGALFPKDIKPELSNELSQLVINSMNSAPQKRPDLDGLKSKLTHIMETDQVIAGENEVKAYQEKALTNRRRYKAKERGWLWFRKYGMATLITAAIVIIFILTWTGSQSKPIITEKDKPREVLTYYFQGIQNLNVTLVDETLHKAKNSFSDMVTNLYVINKTQQGMTYSTKSNIKLEFLGLRIQPVMASSHRVKYQADYILKVSMAKETQYDARKEIFVLEPIRKVWRITQIVVLKEKRWSEKNKVQDIPQPPKGATLQNSSVMKKGA
ncbi:MAG TPA: hypothetical protein DDW50_11555 [Firmicutes bacterium]|jgi:hypothetical protein|nr:hypothetical protein [Bacillota bacterium]